MSIKLTRRAVLGTALAGATAPRLAFGQAQTQGAPMRIECAFARHVFTATLYDNPSARDFASMLPLDLTIDDYSDNEKIAHLLRKLTEREAAPSGTRRPATSATTLRGEILPSSTPVTASRAA